MSYTLRFFDGENVRLSVLDDEALVSRFDGLGYVDVATFTGPTCEVDALAYIGETFTEPASAPAMTWEGAGDGVWLEGPEGALWAVVDREADQVWLCQDGDEVGCWGDTDARYMAAEKASLYIGRDVDVNEIPALDHHISPCDICGKPSGIGYGYGPTYCTPCATWVDAHGGDEICDTVPCEACRIHGARSPR